MEPENIQRGNMNTQPVITIARLGFPWPTLDPFLFCVHHLDMYPEGDDDMGPARPLDGRNLGMDFEGRDGWSMYHGRRVPGFPSHPHRGFETVTIARRGYIDHADSLGATARFGQGDVQWMTAGAGVVHSEMFPLLHRDEPNPTELFQIWLNLPKASKHVAPHFKMLWAPDIPELSYDDANGFGTRVRLVAGELDGHRPPAPPPESWAARPDSHVVIASITMEPGARWTLPTAPDGTGSVLYAFVGVGVVAGGVTVPDGHCAQLDRSRPIELVAGPARTELLLLQGRPIGEPVVQQGPFVMNTPGEIRQAMLDYQQTGFGGWPWGGDDPVHPRDAGRFAVHPDGRRETPTSDRP